MIGVIADATDQDIVREFFELFKTPWEFYRRDRSYDILICADNKCIDAVAQLVIYYSSRQTHFDNEQKIPIGHCQNHACFCSNQKYRIPVYGNTITFAGKVSGFLADEDSGECVAYLDTSSGKMLARIGYDLFSEVRHLLTVGQPIANATLPTLELHIALLRNLIIGCGLTLVEIPPVPEGYRFIACLTHDVDHPLIRQHKWDHTMFGFLYRAIVGSLRNFRSGKISSQNVLRNFAAALKLPFVHLGLAKDFWSEFGDRYLEIEEGLRSTFFVIPYKHYSGMGLNGQAPTFRASCYDVRDIVDTIRKLMNAGQEIGLHGIDAWLDSYKGFEELEEIRRITGTLEIGVRMHWLYYDQQSPVNLEKAGAFYDSTVGYNETVGYRAGTAQVYKPLGANRLLELPMHVMDTALFYPDYLGLSPADAMVVLGRVMDHGVQFGGCVTINWHDRSVAPERLWDASYREVVHDLKSRGAWFATASQAVSWFKKRRSAVFEADLLESEAVRVGGKVFRENQLPGLRLRVHKSQKVYELDRSFSQDYVDMSIPESTNGSDALEARG